MPAPRLHANNAEKQRAYRLRRKAAGPGPEPTQPAPLPAIGAPNIPPARRWNRLAENAAQALTTLRDEMQSYFDDRSDDWKESDRADELQEKIDHLAEMIETLEGME